MSYSIYFLLLDFRTFYFFPVCGNLAITARIVQIRYLFPLLIFLHSAAAIPHKRAAVFRLQKHGTEPGPGAEVFSGA